MRTRNKTNTKERKNERHKTDIKKIRQEEEAALQQEGEGEENTNYMDHDFDKVIDQMDCAVAYQEACVRDGVEKERCSNEALEQCFRNP